MLDSKLGQRVDVPEDPGEQTVRQDLTKLALLLSFSKSDVDQGFGANALGAAQGSRIQPRVSHLDDDDDRPTEVFRIAVLQSFDTTVHASQIQAETLGYVEELGILSESDNQAQFVAVGVAHARHVAAQQALKSQLLPNSNDAQRKETPQQQEVAQKVLYNCAAFRGKYEQGEITFNEAQQKISAYIKYLQTFLCLEPESYYVQMACAFLKDVQRVEDYRCVEIRKAIKSFPKLQFNEFGNQKIFDPQAIGDFFSLQKKIQPLLDFLNSSLPELQENLANDTNFTTLSQLQENLANDPNFTTDFMLSDTVLDFLRLQEEVNGVLPNKKSSSPEEQMNRLKR